MSTVGTRRRRPSGGFLVEASILARLLGIRLLTLDATVVVVPAEVTPPSAAPDYSPARSGVAGRGLAEAVRSINEGAELLAEARRDGS